MDIGMMKLMYSDENFLIGLRQIISQMKGVENILAVSESRRGCDAIEGQ